MINTEANDISTRTLNIFKVNQTPFAKFKFVIHIAIVNRLASFQRLWRSIARANAPSCPVRIVVHTQFDEYEAESHKAYSKYLKSMKKLHAEVSVNEMEYEEGREYNIKDRWAPTSTNEYAIFLESDIIVFMKLISSSRNTF